MGESGTPPSLHRYLYAYGNPVYYVDFTGNAVTPAYSQPLTDQAFQVPTFGTIDTGSNVADYALAAIASVSNLAAMPINGALNTLSLPSRAGGALTGQTAAQFDNQVGALINSTGPLAPLLATGSAPFRAVGTFSKATAVEKLNKLKRSNTRTNDVGGGDVPPPIDTANITGESVKGAIDQKKLETNKGPSDQQLIDSLVDKRKQSNAPGKATFATGRAGDGTQTPVRESIPGKTREQDIHAEPQVLKDLEGLPKPHTVAVDQQPCAACTPKLRDADTRTVVPQDVNSSKRAVKNSAVRASEGRTTVVPREVDLKKND